MIFCQCEYLVVHYLLRLIKLSMPGIMLFAYVCWPKVACSIAFTLTLVNIVSEKPQMVMTIFCSEKKY